MNAYYIARNTDVSASQVIIARGKPYSTLEGAYADMGEGVVFDHTGAIVAFHERHMPILAHRGTARMTNA